MNRLSPNLTRIVIGVLVAAVVVGAGFYFLSGGSTKTVSANFDEAVGVYPGTPVDILGVAVGTVSSVKPEGDHVHITMTYDSTYKLPSNVTASTVANSLVSDRYIELEPAYTGTGPTAPNHYTIGINRTQSPEELDGIYHALNDLATALGPTGANKNGALSNFVNVSAANLTGNGAALGTSITNLSEAAKTLANGSGDLFGTVKNLQVFTKALQGSDTQIRNVETQLAQVSAQLASERGDLGTALHTLAGAIDSVANFVKTNANATHTDLHGLANIAQILVKEQSSLNETLAVGPVALANIVHAYQPDLGVLASRSNLGSLTSLDVCDLINAKVLNGALTGLNSTLAGLGKLLSGLGLGSALGPGTLTIASFCNKILGSKAGTNSAASTPASSSPLGSLIDSVNQPVGGLILGG